MCNYILREQNVPIFYVYGAFDMGLHLSTTSQCWYDFLDTRSPCSDESRRHTFTFSAFLNIERDCFWIDVSGEIFSMVFGIREPPGLSKCMAGALAWSVNRRRNGSQRDSILKGNFWLIGCGRLPSLDASFSPIWAVCWISVNNRFSSQVCSFFRLIGRDNIYNY
ncbi:uncharacterized protein EI90DRAFT_409810 [Cantharellus anzutake]|uniref:uncharacterized protein n=1 Tax=Cantharellus anzutake TaxID=1750568 RepID=UPI001905DD49|nr:uncharacterized protein EI90DRAFT_409810 [Cantharellus anzutake]KAF8314847.1 hypothetical protein EI90DRAFT_409810 [Cantharellus anzutake]